MKLKESLELGGQHLLGWLDPERDYLPTGSWAITHDLGRWWDAMLRLEEATGFVIPGDMEGASLRNLHWLTDNPDGLLFVPPGLDWHPIMFEFHSLREGILTFAALARFRGNRWAAQAGHKYIETLWNCLAPDFSWDVHRFDYARYFDEVEHRDLGHTPFKANQFQKTVSHGRCIEALVWYYRWTEDGLALELAERLARFHLEHAVSADGVIPQYLHAEDSEAGDGQSHLYTLCGLLQFGLLTHQPQYVDAVVKTYEVGFPQLVRECGWVAHDLGMPRYQDNNGNPSANTESTGAAARLALWMAMHTGRSDCYDDVERLVRARLLPGQTTEEDRGNNPDLAIGDKSIGGWGANDYPHAGKGVNPSGTAEVVHTFSAIYQNITSREQAGLFVNMHFDCDGPDARVVVTRDAAASVTITPRVEDALYIRVPGWAEGVTLSVDGEVVQTRMIGAHAYLPHDGSRPGSAVELRYELPERHTRETMPAGDTYEFAWKGDEIVGVAPNDKPLPFYPTLAP
jgi:hypothetical protein